MAGRKANGTRPAAKPAARTAGKKAAPRRKPAAAAIADEAAPPPVDAMADGLPPPDIRGRRLDHPRAEGLKAELLGLDPARPLEILVPDNDPEAAAFAEDIRALLDGAGRAVTIQPVRFDPPFRGLNLHEGAERIQIAIGHR